MASSAPPTLFSPTIMPVRFTLPRNVTTLGDSISTSPSSFTLPENTGLVPAAMRMFCSVRLPLVLEPRVDHVTRQALERRHVQRGQRQGVLVQVDVRIGQRRATAANAADRAVARERHAVGGVDAVNVARQARVAGKLHGLRIAHQLGIDAGRVGPWCRPGCGRCPTGSPDPS